MTLVLLPVVPDMLFSTAFVSRWGRRRVLREKCRQKESGSRGGGHNE